MQPEIGPEAEALLATTHNLVLGTTRRDGSPQLSPVWYLWTDGSLLISTIDTTAKWANLQRDRRCSACVDEPATGKMIVAYGEANLRVEDVEPDTRRLVAKYYPGEPDLVDAHMDRIFNSSDTRVIIDLVPNRIITRRLDLT
jgi:PPOX class probable F420-dependent enzyme